MATTVNFTIPGEPRGKGRPRFDRRGHAYTDARTRDYESYVGHICKAAGASCGAGAVCVTIRAYLGIAKSDSKRTFWQKLKGLIACMKKPDLDNIAKAVLDGINRIAYADDSQVVELHAYKLWSDAPRVEVEVSEVQP